MTDHSANVDATRQRARALRTVRVLTLIAIGFYFAVILNGVLHR